MTRIPTRPILFALSLSFTVLVCAAGAQTGPGGTQGSREAMWPAPTAEDWARPCLIQWQRTWDDAVAVSRETGMPILVCVNMDGEIASEHYAGIRYRQPEITALYAPYVTVIASVYRHNPRDYDEEGRRILCPRFGSVTCGEHIWIEPILYEKFLDERRIAPRHIMVELDGKETYDVYYAFDTQSVFDTVESGIANRDNPLPPVLGDRTLYERVASRDESDRTAVETAYVSGDKVVRRKLLQSAIQATDVSQTDLLRLAIFGLDLELARLARQALAQATDESAIDLIAEALRVPMEATERGALIAALDRLGETWPRAKTLAVVHRGLGTRSGAVDVADWSVALDSAEGPSRSTEWTVLESQLDYKAEQSAALPADPEIHLELAEASLALAVDPQTALSLAADSRTASKYSRLMFQDALRAALKAQELGASGWRLDAAIALSAYYTGNVDEAYARAELAVADMPSGGQDWNAMAVLAIFAEARREGIRKALRARSPWPGEWFTDVHAAYSVLARHPLGTDSQVVAHHDFLTRLGAGGQAARVLDEGLARFPDSWQLHDRLRSRILREKGVAALETAYEGMLREADAAPNLEWHAGYTSLVAAEFHRRAGEDPQAVAAYERAIAHYETNLAAHPESRDSVDHYVALALAGRARVAAERGDDEAALADLLASFARREEAAASLDGLNISAVATARMLLARLSAAGNDELASTLQAALDGLDPDLLRPAEFDRVRPNVLPTDGRPPRRGR